MSLGFRLLLTGVVVARTALAAGLGGMGFLVPSVALAGTLVAARLAKRPRFRVAAILGGAIEGLIFGGAWLVRAIVLLLIGALLRATRRTLPLERLLPRIVLGFLAATLLMAGEALFQWILGVDVRASAPAGALWVEWAGSALLYPLAEAALARAPRLRYEVQRH